MVKGVKEKKGPENYFHPSATLGASLMCCLSLSYLQTVFHAAPEGSSELK